MTAYTKIDGVMLSKMLPERIEEVGIYAAGFRFFDAANMVGVLSAGILLPMYAKNLNNKTAIYSLIKTGLLTLGGLIFAGVLFLYFFSSPILAYVYDEYTPYYDEVFYYIIYALIPLIIVHVLGPLMLAIKKLNNINKIFFLALILNISLNYVLIPSQAAKGAAEATLITQVVVALSLIPITFLEIRKFFKDKEQL
jgi:O-antigen/teichoic acid export membrane protein